MLPSSTRRKSIEHQNPKSSPPRADVPYPRHGQGPPRSSRVRRPSVASSIHSIGGSLDTVTSSLGSSVLESGQNAISVLLQPPIVRTGLQAHLSAPTSSIHKPPTPRDIPPVALTNIVHVEASEFHPYLTQVGALYEQLRRARESDDETPGRKGSRGEGMDVIDEIGSKSGSRSQLTRNSSSTSIASIETLSGSTRRGSSSHSRKGQGPPPLSTIPNVYFEDNFHLENPRTFDVVSERSEVVRPAPGAADHGDGDGGDSGAPRKALATNAILQEKLSWYMDTIEVHLINSISAASTTFFSALGSLRELQGEASETVEKIKALRSDLKELDKEIVIGGLEIIGKKQRQENLQQLNDAILQLKQVVDGVAKCEALVDAGEVDKALDGIDSLEMLISGESRDSSATRLRDLRGATALQSVDGDLATLRFRIGRAFEERLHSLLLGDLRKHATSVSSQDVLLRWSSASMRARGGHAREPSAFPSYLGSTESLRTSLVPVIVGLYRANHIGAAVTMYRDLVMREIRNIVRRPLPSSSDDDNESIMSASTMSGSKGGGLSNQQKSSILARNLRALDEVDSEKLLSTIYVGVTETLRRFTTQTKILLDVTSELGEPNGLAGIRSPPRSPAHSPAAENMTGFETQEEMHKALDLANLLGQAVDAAHDKIIRVLRVRAEQSIDLPLASFLRYFILNLYFANECEAISGRSGTALKTLVNGHIRDFVKRHGDREIQTLAQGMGTDNWNAKDFSERDTEILQLILESSTSDPPVWTNSTKIWIPLDDETNNGQAAAVANGVPDTNGAGKEKVRRATIDPETFLLPQSAILCLEGVSHFMHLVTGIPSMTGDVASSLIAYLQMFNSRCTQLILGAGATRSAGLKHITAKHLALASQGLGFLAALLPHIREFVRRHAGSGPNTSSLMGDFDKVRRLFQEHQDNICQKLVEIMSSRGNAHSKVMKTIDWDDGNAPRVHAYMETLAKETSTLHRVLVNHLPEQSIQLIMLPVFDSYKEQLGSAIQMADPKTEAGRESMLRDIKHLESKLSKIVGFGDLGEYLRKSINSKEIKKPLPPSPPPEAIAEAEEAKSSSSPSLGSGEKEEPEENGTQESKADETKKDGDGDEE